MAEASLPTGFVAALEALAHWLKAEQVPHATIGGVAVSLISQPRATQDILDLTRIRRWVSEFASALEMPEIEESVEKLFERKRR